MNVKFLVFFLAAQLKRLMGVSEDQGPTQDTELRRAGLRAGDAVRDGWGTALGWTSWQNQWNKLN